MRNRARHTLGVALALVGLVAAPAPTLSRTATAQNCLTDGTGALQAELRGALTQKLNWINEGTACSGFTSQTGPVRLQFSRRVDHGELVIDLTIRGLDEGTTGRSFRGSVAISGSAVQSQAFETTAGACTFTVVENTRVTATLLENTYKLVGSARCAAPAVTEAPGPEITITALDFTGQTRWSKSS